MGVGGAKTKFADNIAAIRLLKQLQEAGAEQAGSEEKKILVRYAGWGGLPQAFDLENEKWAAEYQELRSVLTPDEYAKARRSTQDAHFTSETVIKGIYEGLSALGLNTGTKPHILEPSAGIGNFMGLCPDDLNAKFVAVELDPTTAAISQYLYPEARHINNGFQNASFSASRFDAVVGKPKDKYGLIDTQGRWVIPAEFGQIYFNETFYQVTKDGAEGLYTRDGMLVAQVQYKSAYNVGDGLAVVGSYSERGYMNRRGEWLFAKKFSDLGEFSEGLAKARENGKYGFINKKGDWVVTPRFSAVGSFVGGVAFASVDGDKIGLINRQGEWVRTPIFEKVSFAGFSSGLAGVKRVGYGGL